MPVTQNLERDVAVKRMGRRWLAVAAAAVILVGGLYAFRAAWLPQMALWLDVGEPPSPCDYVMVLGGGENTRPFVAAALVKAGLAHRVLVSHAEPTFASMEGVRPPTHEIIQNVLQCRGVPKEQILILARAGKHTYDEAQMLADFLQNHPEGRVTVVTDGFHTRRAHWVFSKVLGEQSSRVVFLSAPNAAFTASDWWQNPWGFQMILSEYVKLAGYALLYGHPAYYALPLALLVAAAVLFRRRRAALRSPNGASRSTPSPTDHCADAKLDELRSTTHSPRQS